MENLNTEKIKHRLKIDVKNREIKEQEELRRSKYRKWCCWELDEEEIYHILGGIITSKNPVGLLTDDEICEIVENFRDRLSIVFEEWESNLEEIVKNVIRERSIKLE
ncbi:MAG: hypothetical protein PHP08_00805 [Candidatus Dojkabacteria bacterium]|nr:hypothetical protein [Candidatus Dojkabacteria bacterium]